MFRINLISLYIAITVYFFFSFKNLLINYYNYSVDKFYYLNFNKTF